LRKVAAPQQKRTVPLPLEIVFRPDVRGTYNPRRAKEIDEAGKTYNPLKDSFTPTAVRFDFKPDDVATRPLVLPEVEDPWHMREEILCRPEDENERLDAITGYFGRWGVGRDDLLVPRTKFPSDCDVFTATDLLRGEYMEWLSLIRAAMAVRTMNSWPNLKTKFPESKVNMLSEPMALSVEWRNGRPVGIIRCSGILRALIATLQIEKLMDAEWRWCAREGCRKGFEVKRKDRWYCNKKCQHRQLIKDGRDERRRAAQKQNGRHPERKSK
jgi:hypothetical protein